MTKTAIQMTPGDDTNLTLLMAPHGLNLVTGQDREHLLAFGRAVFEAGKATAVQGKCLHQIAEPQKFTVDSEMSRAFEVEYGQDWADPDWRREAGVWASAGTRQLMLPKQPKPSMEVKHEPPSPPARRQA